MTNNYLIIFLAGNSTILKLKSLLKEICQLDLNIIDLEGNVINSAKTATESIDPQSSLPLSLFKPDLHVRFIQKAVQSQSICIITTQPNELSVFVPIQAKEQLVGFFLTQTPIIDESTRPHMESIANFLQDIIQLVISSSFNLLADYEASNVTHQKKTVNKATQYIRRNYYQSTLSLTDVSKKNGVSYHYLSRLFKKELNTSFNNYLNNIRLDVASRLLKDPSLTVSQISYSCGFGDPGYFSKVFKKNYGTSPASFRNKTTPSNPLI